MAFIDKKEQVIEIKLTQFGKNSLARGVFKPEYYQFFDDDIIYDRNYTSVSEDQNATEDRIKNEVRLETQHLVKGIQTRFDAETKKIQSGERGVFEKLVREMDPLEKEKLLQSPLYACKLGSQETPRFTLVPYTTELKNITGGVQYLTQSGIQGKIPQIEMQPLYKVTLDVTEQTEDSGELYDSETFLDLSSNKIVFDDKTFIEVEPSCVAISLDEFNVPYDTDNFEIELYEIVDTQTTSTSERETKMVAIKDPEEIFALFDIKTDKHANKVPKNMRTTENFYTKQE